MEKFSITEYTSNNKKTRSTSQSNTRKLNFTTTSKSNNNLTLSTTHKSSIHKKINSHKHNLASFKSLRWYSIQRLIHKHNCRERTYNKQVINNLIYTKNCHIVCQFKDDLIFNCPEEFLKRYYTYTESLDRLPTFAKYYRNYLAFFCKPYFVHPHLNIHIQKNGDNKAELYYVINYGKNKNKNKKNRDQDSKLEEINKIFDTTIKKNIDHASITISDIIDESPSRSNIISRNIMFSTQGISGQKQENLFSNFNKKLKQQNLNFYNKQTSINTFNSKNQNIFKPNLNLKLTKKNSENSQKEKNNVSINLGNDSIDKMKSGLMTTRSKENSFINLLSSFEKNSEMTKKIALINSEIETMPISSINFNTLNGSDELKNLKAKISKNKLKFDPAVSSINSQRKISSNFDLTNNLKESIEKKPQINMKIDIAFINPILDAQKKHTRNIKPMMTNKDSKEYVTITQGSVGAPVYTTTSLATISGVSVNNFNININNNFATISTPTHTNEKTSTTLNKGLNINYKTHSTLFPKNSKPTRPVASNYLNSVKLLSKMNKKGANSIHLKSQLKSSINNTNDMLKFTKTNYKLNPSTINNPIDTNFKFKEESKNKPSVCSLNKNFAFQTLSTFSTVNNPLYKEKINLQNFNNFKTFDKSEKIEKIDRLDKITPLKINKNFNTLSSQNTQYSQKDLSTIKFNTKNLYNNSPLQKNSYPKIKTDRMISISKTIENMPQNKKSSGIHLIKKPITGSIQLLSSTNSKYVKK
jgi:hypothetical protein